jgi:hypothetical protein
MEFYRIKVQSYDDLNDNCWHLKDTELADLEHLFDRTEKLLAEKRKVASHQDALSWHKSDGP